MLSRGRARLVTVAVGAGGLAAGALLTATQPASAAPRFCQGEEVTIEAASSDSTVLGTEGPDVIDGIGRHDLIIEGLGGDDVICAGPGFAVVVHGGEGADRIEGEEIYGGPGNDLLQVLVEGLASGDEGDDRLVELDVTGLYSPAVLVPGPGDDTVVGAAHSTLQFGGAEGVRIDARSGVADGEGHDTFSGIKLIVGTPFSDTFIGSSGPDLFFGETWRRDAAMEGGPDVAYGGGGSDQLILFGRAVGGTGDDRLRVFGTSAAKGGVGDDELSVWPTSTCRTSAVCRARLDGEAGRDTVVFEIVRRVGVRVDLAAGRARQPGLLVRLLGLENVEGTRRDDVLLGDGQANLFNGGSGDDVLQGRAGRDRLLGYSGHDRLDGGAGPDRLLGNAGHDRADGGAGPDRCEAEVRISC